MVNRRIRRLILWIWIGIAAFGSAAFAIMTMAFGWRIALGFFALVTFLAVLQYIMGASSGPSSEKFDWASAAADEPALGDVVELDPQDVGVQPPNPWPRR